MRYIIFFFVLFLFACQSEKSPSVAQYFDYTPTQKANAGVQMIPIQTEKGTFKVWTKRFGNNPKTKVLILHGGPALTHEYMECFEPFFLQEGIEFYEYDQLGSYYSDQPTDSSLWTLDRYVEEVEQVRKALNLDKDNFYLLGNSWGGILAMQYALKYQDHLKGLLVCNMMASYPRYAAYNGVLRSKLRPSYIDSVNVFEAKGDYKNPIYTHMVTEGYYRKHICRLAEWPEPVNRGFKHVNEQIYVIMQGPSEFKAGGRLTNWDIMDKLPSLKIPTLMVGAQYDTMDPKDMEEQAKLVQKGRFLFCPNGSHLSMWDDQEVFMKGILTFIRDVEKGNFAK